MKFRRKRRTEESNGGEDAFLDIVANLVGILVILVMVIGVRTQDAWNDSQQEVAQPAVSIDLLAERERIKSSHASINRNVLEVKGKLDELTALTQDRHHERHQLQVLMEAARRELAERRKSLDDERADQVVAAAEVRELEAELELIERQTRTLETEEKPPIELEHLPTPMARTVFGHEEHFRLLNGRLTYVPLNELTELLKSDAARKVQKLSQANSITETIGPIQGFHLKYTLARREVTIDSRVGPMQRQVVDFQGFVLLPMSNDLGEPMDQALTDGSQFYQLVETFRPGSTVVTVWTYPDSFEQFRRLKRWLYDRGFSSAARPLPEGQPISGSPNGSRSAAQ